VISEGTNKRTYLFTSKIVYRNQGEKNLSLEDNAHFFTVFMNTTGQTVYLLNVTNPHELQWDDDGNPLIMVNVSSIPPKGNVTVTISMQIEKYEQEPPNLQLSDAKNREDIPIELKEEHCQTEGSWLVDDELLIALASDIWVSEGESENVFKIVMALADWVGDSIDSVSHEVPLYPNDTYLLKEGDCDDQANLLITLCRILGIPAYLQLGAIRKSGKDEGTAWDDHIEYSLQDIGYHGWAMIYIPPWGWLPFDMTLAWKKNSVEGITAAPIWTLDAITSGNIITSDWAGDSQRHKEEIINSSLFFYYEDELIIQNGDTGLTEFLNLLPYWLFVLCATAIIVFYRRWKGKMKKIHSYNVTKVRSVTSNN
jgi:hypothetical protein